jgi:hypothetical protein
MKSTLSVKASTFALFLACFKASLRIYFYSGDSRNYNPFLAYQTAILLGGQLLRMLSISHY